MDAQEVIAAFGKPSRLAKLCGVEPGAVSNWKKDGIPSKRWRQIAKLAAEQGIPGITVETLSEGYSDVR